MTIEFTQELMQEVMEYNTVTGKAFWKHRPRKFFPDAAHQDTWNARFAGKEIGCISTDGYIYCGLFNKKYKLHRLIWLLQTGSFPNQIDHINHIRTDNRWENLRNCTQRENSKNVSRRKKSLSGVTGISWSNAAQKWRARICIEGESFHLGVFNSIEDAAKVIKAFQEYHNFHENHGK